MEILRSFPQRSTGASQGAAPVAGGGGPPHRAARRCGGSAGGRDTYS